MKKTPSIRTRSISTEWKKKSIGEYTDVKSAARVHKDEWQEDGIPFFRTSDVMAAYNHTSNERAFISKELYDRLIARSGKLEMGDLLVTGGGSIGTPYIVPDDQPLYTKDADLLWIKKCRELDPAFLYAFYLSPGFRRYLKEISHTGTISHYTIEQIKETPVIAPDIKEQQYVGYLFQQVDRLLLLHQRKLDTLISVRKSMLQKMFPRNGSKVPEIRFKGFDGEWEERPFGALFRERRDKTETEYEDTLLSCAIDGMYLNSELFDHFRGSSTIGYLKVKKNDLILSAQNLHLGNANVNLRFDSGIISPAYKVYDIVECDPYFIQTWVKQEDTKRFFLAATTEGASACRKNIEWDVLNQQTLYVPTLPEQLRIGIFFKDLDNYIALTKAQIDTLKKVKRSLLTRMFA